MSLTVGSLFSGIGGLDLGLERAGMRVIWQSEIDPYACKVLSKHWPEVVNHGNIKEINWQEIERPDVICGGYPCQPFSQAGKRRGEEDPRHLWPWVREAISQLRPRYAILENVRGHLSLGGTTVIGELASIGYDAEWRVVSAASVGAPHRRDRIVIVAYPNNTGSGTPERGFNTNRSQVEQERQDKSQRWFSGCSVDVAYPDSGDAPDGRQCASVQGKGGSRRNDRGRSERDARQVSVGSTRFNPCEIGTENSVYSGERQRSYAGWQWWQVEPDVGRVADGIPSRVDRLKGLGNAVVPQVAEVIGRLVVAHFEGNSPDLR